MYDVRNIEYKSVNTNEGWCCVVGRVLIAQNTRDDRPGGLDPAQRRSLCDLEKGRYLMDFSRERVCVKAN